MSPRRDPTRSRSTYVVRCLAPACGFLATFRTVIEAEGRARFHRRAHLGHPVTVTAIPVPPVVSA